ncbi:MAG: efflux RND transporter periplasmic adaptor subunit [bacterium]
MSYKKITLSFTLSLIVFLILCAIGWWFWQNIFHSCSEDPKVKTVQVKRGRITTIISGVGRVESAQVTTLRANITGMIKDILVKEGDMVKRHQELIKFDIDETENKLLQAKNNLSLAIIEVESSRQQLENTKELYRADAVSKLQLDTDQRQYDKAVVQQKQAEEELKFAKILFDKLSCRSVQEGTVMSKEVENGQTVHPGEPLLTIADTNRLQIKVEVDEIDALKVKVGQRVFVAAEVLPDKELSGRVIWIAPSAKRKNNSTIVEAIVKLTQDIPLLKIGMQVDINFIISDKEDVLCLPVKGIIRENNKSYVFLYQDGVAFRREIKTGLSNFESIEIISGLNAGDEIIITEGYKIKPGDKVVKE